jgi:hypothetical protein
LRRRFFLSVAMQGAVVQLIKRKLGASMSRLMGLILALSLTVGGAGWLVFQLFMAEEYSRNLLVAATIYGPISSPVVNARRRR